MYRHNKCVLHWRKGEEMAPARTCGGDAKRADDSGATAPKRGGRPGVLLLLWETMLRRVEPSHEVTSPATAIHPSGSGGGGGAFLARVRRLIGLDS